MTWTKQTSDGRDQTAGTASDGRVPDELVERAKQGCHLAHLELARLYDRMVFTVAYRILRNNEDAQDATQETFMRVFTRLNTFKGDSKFSTWLTRVAINTSLMHSRRQRARPTCSIEDLVEGSLYETSVFASSAPNPERECLTHDLKRRLLNAINDLPPSLRGVTIVRYSNDLSIEETARRSGLSVAATKSRLLRARHALRSSLSPKGAAPLHDQAGFIDPTTLTGTRKSRWQTSQSL